MESPSRKKLNKLCAEWAELGRALTIQEISAGLGSVRLSRSDFSQDEVRFSDECYQRNSVYSGTNFTALLLCWRSGQVTAIHNHEGSACVVTIVQGTATETIFKWSNAGSLYPAETVRAIEGSRVCSHDQDIHLMGNLEGPGEDLLSLHIYSPPLTAMKLFSLSDTCMAKHEATREAIARLQKL